MYGVYYMKHNTNLRVYIYLIFLRRVFKNLEELKKSYKFCTNLSYCDKHSQQRIKFENSVPQNALQGGLRGSSKGLLKRFPKIAK